MWRLKLILGDKEEFCSDIFCKRDGVYAGGWQSGIAAWKWVLWIIEICNKFASRLWHAFWFLCSFFVLAPCISDCEIITFHFVCFFRFISPLFFFRRRFIATDTEPDSLPCHRISILKCVNMFKSIKLSEQLALPQTICNLCACVCVEKTRSLHNPIYNTVRPGIYYTAYSYLFIFRIHIRGV